MSKILESVNINGAVFYFARDYQLFDTEEEIAARPFSFSCVATPATDYEANRAMEAAYDAQWAAEKAADAAYRAEMEAAYGDVWEGSPYDDSDVCF